jgi:hypothetical protein
MDHRHDLCRTLAAQLQILNEIARAAGAVADNFKAQQMLAEGADTGPLIPVAAGRKSVAQ